MDLLPTFAGYADDNASSVPNPAAVRHAGHNNGTVTTETGELFQGYSSTLLTIASIVCYVFMMLGIPGNLITIIALARCKKVRNATAAFIINLSLSDLLFCCFNLPLAASTFWHRDWVHSHLLCRLWPLLRYGLLAVSLFTILAITINRYIMIGHPRIYPRIYRRKYLGLMVACTWIFAFCALIPTWRGVWGNFGLDKSIGSCSILKDLNGNSPKEFLFLIAFALPCMFIVICYARIFYIVRRTAIRSRETALKPAVSTRTIDRPAHNNNSSSNSNNSNKEQEQNDFTVVQISPVTMTKNNCDNNMYQQSHRRRASSSVEKDSQEGGEGEHDVILTTSEKRRCLLTKIKDEDLKFIDTSIDSDNNNYLIRNMTSDTHVGHDEDKLSVEIVSEEEPEDEYVVTLGNGLLSAAVDKGDSALEDESIGDCVTNGGRGEAGQATTMMMNGSQYLAVLVEPSSSSGIDVALDQDEPVQPNKKPRKYMGSIKRSVRYGKRRQDRNNNSNAGRKHSTLGNNTSASAIYPGKMSNKDRRLLKMILVIFISFLMCYLPITVTKINSSVTNIHLMNILGYLLIYLTTCINPIIYVVMSSEYRQAYWNLILCRVNTWNRREAMLANNNNNHHRKGSVRT